MQQEDRQQPQPPFFASFETGTRDITQKLEDTMGTPDRLSEQHRGSLAAGRLLISKRRQDPGVSPNVCLLHPPLVVSGPSATDDFAVDRNASRRGQPLASLDFSTPQIIAEDGDAHIVEQMEQKDHHEDVQKLLCLPDVNIPPMRRKQTPRQMSCSLMEHQKVCLTWLLQQEEDKHKKGGLLADTMGLGKTVQALALILSRPSKDPLRKTTLIVAPLALLKQWEREIATKVKPQYRLRTVIFHGSKAKKMTVSQLLEHDVVLCTYGKLQHEYTTKHEIKKSPLKILHRRAKFYRVILDEAHNIKNKDTKASKAAAEIRSRYRLCMTGTPFQNRAEEIFPLIRFLRISPYNDWQAFCEGINRLIRRWDGDEQEAGMVKLQALIRSITMRRTKDSRLDGKRIVELRPRKESPAPAQFDAEQQAFYNALESQQRLTFNKYVAAGTVMKNYMEVLVLILRLRQACDHPFLIKNHGIPEGAKLGPNEMIRLALKLPDDVVSSINKQGQFKCPLCGDKSVNPVIIHPCGHYICPACFTASMTIRETEGIHEEEPSGPLNTSWRHDRDPVVTCYHDECDGEITPTNILCYNFFVDAHMADGSALLDDSFEGFAYNNDSEALDGSIVDSDDSGGAADDEYGSDWVDDDSKPFQSLVKDKADSASIHSTDSLMIIDDVSQGPIKGSREDPIKIDSSDESSNSTKMTSDWRKCEIAKLKRMIKALENDDLTNDGEDITDIQLQARPPKRKLERSTGEVTTIARKKSRGEGHDHCIGLDKEPSQRNNTFKTNGNYRPKKETYLSLSQMKRDAQRSAAAMTRYKKRLRKEWVSSCKIDKTMEILESIRKRNSKEKTLIFSLWTSFLDLLEIPIEDAGFNYTRYDGSMKPDARDAAVQSFMDDPAVGVMLISLKAGNVGLNLTTATQVIILEPFWNPYVEEQAIDRAHRIGQKKEVTVHRVLIANTIEDRILELQEKKKLLVDAALSERGARVVSRLDVHDLRMLFNA